MFENMIDPVIERCRPHAVTLRDECRMFAAGVFDRLDRIADTIAEDATVFLRRAYPVAVSGTGTANIAGQPTGVLWEVPPGETWELEMISARTSASGTLVIYRSGVEVMTISVTTGGRTPIGGNGLRFMPGDTVGYEIASATAITGTVYGQIRVERPRTRHTNHDAGFRNPAIGPPTIENETQRHVGAWHPGIPALGPSAQ